MNPCEQINAMLATQQQLKLQFEAQVLVDEVALALATVQLRNANENHLQKQAAFNTSTNGLRMVTQAIEQLSMMHAAMMCN